MDPQPDAPGNPSVLSMSRRGFLRSSAVFGAGAAAFAASLKPLLELEDFTSMEKFLQKYYKEMTPADMAKVLQRIAGEVEHRHQRELGRHQGGEGDREHRRTEPGDR